MDELITKPTTIAVLADRLRRLLPGAPWTDLAGGGVAPPVDASAPEAGVLDAAVLEEMTDGDPALAESLLADFVATVRADLDAIERALASGDREAVRTQAHRVAGASSMVGATTLRRSAQRLEKLATEGEAEEGELRELARSVALEAERVATLANQP
jgi:HPt (histidine-containing phosphotransfer) domain-containing protein